jgi:hypothetical protein
MSHSLLSDASGGTCKTLWLGADWCNTSIFSLRAVQEDFCSALAAFDFGFKDCCTGLVSLRRNMRKYQVTLNTPLGTRTMDAEQINQIGTALTSLTARTLDLRGYL